MGKRQDIELLRLLAAFGIVWFHWGGPGHEVAYSALIVFLVISGYLSANSEAALGTARVLARSRRILLPWAFWLAVYGLENLVRGRPLLTQPGWLAGILNGTSPHLWYMPFILGASLLLDVVRTHATKYALAVLAALTACLLLASAQWWRAPSVPLQAPLAQYVHAAAGVLIGVFFRFFSVPPRLLSLALLVALFAAGAAAFACGGVGMPYTIGMAIALPLIAAPPAIVGKLDLTAISECALGVYLSHALFLEVVARLPGISGLVVPVVAFIGALTAIYLSRRLFPRLAVAWS